MPPIAPTGRDLRLDLFRGLALWLIFLDHIPSNIVNWITIRNYGFSDAAEIFVFISGYTAAFVYGRAMQERGFIVASARILKRVWQVYVAHVFIFVIFMAEIAYLTRSLDNPLYSEEMRAFDFLQQPGVALVQALMLKFQPNFMDVLPLYIVLLLALPVRAVADAAAADAHAAAVGRALCGGAAFLLEPAGLSDRHLVLQSARLAADLRGRRLVRGRRRRACQQARALARRGRHCDRLSRARLPDRA